MADFLAGIMAALTSGLGSRQGVYEATRPLGLPRGQGDRRTAEPPNRIQDIAREKRNITPGTALRLAKLFGNCAEFWMNLQNHYDFERELASSAEAIDPIQPLAADA